MIAEKQIQGRASSEKEVRRKVRGKEIVKSLSSDGWSFCLIKVPCGKASCSKCPHGPYWYAYRNFGGKTREVYVGKDITAWAQKRGGRIGSIIAKMEEREDLLGEEVNKNGSDGDNVSGGAAVRV